MKKMVKGALCLGLLVMATQVQAGEPISENSGFSGFVQLGVRQDVGRAGIVGDDILFTSFPTEV